MSLFATLCAAHMRLAWRGGQTVLAVSFLFIAITLLPFGLGPELKIAARIGARPVMGGAGHEPIDHFGPPVSGRF